MHSLAHTACRRLGVATIVQAVALCTDLGWIDYVAADGASVESADPRVTWGQRLYLEAFDQSLRAAEDRNELERTRLLREAALSGVFKESGTKPDVRPASTDPIARIALSLTPPRLIRMALACECTPNRRSELAVATGNRHRREPRPALRGSAAASAQASRSPE